MKKHLILCVLCLALFSSIFPETLTIFPDMVKPIELRMDDQYIYISDQHSVFVYDINNLKPVIKHGRKGEGPEEFKTNPRIAFTDSEVILYDSFKIILYTKDLKLIKEISLHSRRNRVNPVGNLFVLPGETLINNKKHLTFALYKRNMEKIKDLVIEPENQDSQKYFLFPSSRCRTINNRIFIAQPQKEFYISVFNEKGELICVIGKKVEKIKSEPKHRNLNLQKIKYYVGKRTFQRAQDRGAFNKPLPEFIHIIKNFWVSDARIYVKTNDIADSKEKYVIMDFKGNILKSVFLPYTFMEILTFNKDKFYYLQEIENGDGWALHVLKI